MQQHVADPYVRRAQVHGYRSRAAFKLIEIDAKDRLFAPGQAVVDLGAAPGSWSQVAAEKATSRGLVVAVGGAGDRPPAGGPLLPRGVAQGAGLAGGRPGAAGPAGG